MSGRGEAPAHNANPFHAWHDQTHSCRGRGMPPAAQQQQKVLQQQLDIQQQAAQPNTQHRVGFVPPPPPRNIPQRGDGPPPVPPRKRPPPPPKEPAPPSYPELYSPPRRYSPPPRRYSPPPRRYSPPPRRYSPPPRRYSHTAADIQLLPPPRSNPARKFSEGSVPAAGYKFNSKRGATVILPPPIKTDFVEPKPEPDKISERQDSNVSSDSFSQSSSPSYTNKSMEAPLLPNLTKKKRYQIEKELAPIRLERKDDVETIEDTNTSPITKSHSTPASLQTIVRLQTGSSMSLHHRIIRDIRRPSSHYMKNNRLRCHFLQVTINILAIIAIAGGLAIYFKAYPNTTVRYVNRTVTTTRVSYVHHDVNPAPGLCLPVIVPFCIHHGVPYNYTIFPNYVGHFNQRDASQELEVYDALVDVRCYELASLFLCSIFVPKCGAKGSMVRPCKNLCYETKRRCGFFLEVFGLALPPYLDCDLFPDSEDTDICIGHKEVLEAEQRAKTPKCTTGFQCDAKRCIPPDWRCDGHVDCEDQTDELNCESCPPEMIHCGTKTCITQSHMCDGEVNCPWGQDERNCLRLSEKMGDEGQGKLEIFQPELQSWRPACVQNWNENTSAKSICNFLGYGEVNSSHITTKATNGHALLPTSVRGTYKKKKTSLNLKELRNCPTTSYATLDLTCHNVLCGQRRVASQPSKRIIGGVRSTPGNWPFLAALLGGPEQVFYCAGVLISDQWVLTASHCVGNFSHGDTSGWTIQLGITRRHAHSYFGQKAKVKRVVPHPMYNIGIAHDNDVALFQLQQKVTFHEHLVPVCLPEEGYVLKPDTLCTVVGWGKREDSDMSEYEATVNEVQVPVLNRSLCNKWLEPRDLNVTQGMICAGYKEGGKDACQGDSGGPLLCRTDKNVDRWFVGGIVSWGIKCAHPRLPGVYAYVPHYVPWIKEQIARYSD